LINVDFPEPLWPTRACTSLGRTSKSILLERALADERLRQALDDQHRRR
jgi:hypothetical protein